MTSEELKRRIREERPDAPLGFDTRVDAKVNELTNKGVFAMKKIRFGLVVAMAMVACLLVAGAVGFATSTNNEAQYLIPKLDMDAHLEEKTDYVDNTVSLAGLSLRDQYPGLTDKWYNVVPVDLTIQGRQTFTMVASNLFYIGECYVDVAGDNVTVTYATYRGNLQRLNECMNWFTNVKDITTDYLENPVGGFAFGEKVSISKSLDGAKTALLFICNRVTYSNPYGVDGASLIRYWPNKEDWKEFRTGLNGLMDRMEGEIEQRRIEAEAKAKAEAEAKAKAEAEAKAKAEEEAKAAEAAKAAEEAKAAEATEAPAAK